MKETAPGALASCAAGHGVGARWEGREGAQAEVVNADQAKDLSVRTVADATIAQAETGKARETAAEAVPPLREAEARAAAALQRLIMARDTLDAEENRAKERLAELERRLAQFEQDTARERSHASDAEAALAKLAEEEEVLKREALASAESRAGVDQRVFEADSVVSAAETMFGELTAALAELTASRNQLSAAIKAEAERISRFDSELGNIEAGLAAAAESRPDLDAMAAAAETAMAAVTQAGEAAVAAESAHINARKTLEGARQPLTEAERAVQRLEKFGLASRCSGADDKRVVMVSATDDGRERHAEAAHRRQELIRHILGVFDREEFEQLASNMERFVGALDDFVVGISTSAKKD